jgi:hypothetical protein
VKLDEEMLLTVPDAPPAAGPDRALGAPLLAVPAVMLLVEVTGCASVVEWVVASTMERPITAEITAAAATSQRRLGTRRPLDRLACSAVGGEAGQSGDEAGGGGGVAAYPLALAAADGSDTGIDTGRLDGVSSGVVDSRSLIMALLSLEVTVPKIWTVPVRRLGVGCDAIGNRDGCRRRSSYVE